MSAAARQAGQDAAIVDAVAAQVELQRRQVELLQDILQALRDLQPPHPRPEVGGNRTGQNRGEQS